MSTGESSAFLTVWAVLVVADVVVGAVGLVMVNAAVLPAAEALAGLGVHLEEEVLGVGGIQAARAVALIAIPTAVAVALTALALALGNAVLEVLEGGLQLG